MFGFLQSKKFLTIVLILSLGLNIFLVMQELGHQTRQQLMMGRLTERQIQRLVDAAPEKKQVKLKKTLDANVKDIRQDLDAIHKERQNLANLMTADKFDEDALQRQFAILRVRMNYLQKHLQLLTMNMLRELSPEERMKAVQMMQPKKLWQPRPPAEEKTIEIKPDGKAAAEKK
jgi:uncharacterized membrane protein